MGQIESSENGENRGGFSSPEITSKGTQVCSFLPEVPRSNLISFKGYRKL